MESNGQIHYLYIFDTFVVVEERYIKKVDNLLKYISGWTQDALYTFGDQTS